LSEATANNGKQSKQDTITELDLTKIDGNGDFPCPSCGVTISPEDESEEVYTIIEEKLNGEILEELIIQCNTCSCRIRLTGFPDFDFAPEANTETEN
jgi:predicted RNA-binding Zn-ribbon protein involved in translation (DUF1610 family)